MTGRIFVLAVAVAAVAPPAARAGFYTDPAADFIPSYTGPQGGDLDVIGAEVLFDGTAFTFHAVLNAPIGTTPGVLSYVFGVNRGAGTAGFNATLGLDGVLFDRVVILRSDLTGAVGGVGPLPAGSVTVSGNEIFGTVGLALLPSTGFTPDQYTWNLWPRSPGAGVQFISDFAPDNSNVTVTAVPAPAALGLLASALLGLPLVRRARR